MDRVRSLAVGTLTVWNSDPRRTTIIAVYAARELIFPHTATYVTQVLIKSAMDNELEWRDLEEHDRLDLATSLAGAKVLTHMVADHAAKQRVKEPKRQTILVEASDDESADSD